jgi:uncharacterized membrane protein YgdD (TMEM256/DUF423 family)
MSPNRLLCYAGLAGLLGVALGAFGAHALHNVLAERQTAALWQTAVLYHLVHAVALLGLAGWTAGTEARLPSRLNAAAACWISGMLLFSGSLYGMALGAPRAFGWITPVGGLLLLAGWSLIAMHGWRASRNEGQQRPTSSDH